MGKKGKIKPGTSQSHYSHTNLNVKVVPDEGYSNFNRYRTYPPDSTYRKHENTGMNYRYDRFSRHPTKTSEYYGHGRGRKYTWKKSSKKSSPTTSPAHLGSEEHTMQKIKQTSAIIMRQLLNPEENIIAKSVQDSSPNNSLESMKEQETNIDKTTKNTSKMSKNKSKEPSYSVEEIHNKIMYHLTNLNKGKKRNLINSNSTGYDEPIQHIMKQKRLEISRALRNMCSDDNDPKSTDFINSIIPDMGIKIEDLPQEFLEELRHSFDFSIQNGFPMMNNYYPEIDVNSVFADLCQPPTYDNSFDYPTTSNQFSDRGNVPPPNFFHVNINEIDTEAHMYEKSFDSRVQAPEDNFSSSFRNDDIIWNENVSSANTNVHRFPEEINHTEEISHNVKSEVEETIPEIDEPISTTNEIMTTKDSHQLKPSTAISNVNLKMGADFASDKCIFSQSTNETANKKSNQTNPVNDISNPVSNDMRDFDSVVDNESQNPRLDINNMEQPSSSTELHISKETGELNENIVEIRKEDIYNESQYNFEVKKECEDTKDSIDLNLGTAEVILKEDEVITAPQAREYAEASTQTLKKRRTSMKFFLKQTFPKPPSTVDVAVRRMSYIDDYISDLIDYRKNVLSQYIAVEKLPVIIKKRDVENERKRKIKKKVNKKKDDVETEEVGDKRVAKKRKNSMEQESNIEVEDKEASVKVDMVVKKRKNNLMEDNPIPSSSVVENEESVEKSADAPVGRLIDSPVPVQNMLVFKQMEESILDLKVFGDKLMAATQSGKIVFFSLEDGRQINHLKVSKKPISCLLCLEAPDEKVHICVGSFDGFLKEYNFYSQCLLRTIKLSENAQCMEYNWDYLFIGGSKGSILRYSMKKRVIEYEDKFYDDCIFVLKATQEGARRVLLIGSRNSPVVIRDAMNGLHLRTMQDLVCPTVYSLVVENNMVYCGTTNLDILVFNFHNGRLVHKLKAASAKGIGCLKTFGRLLFASCHNGNVYVYNTEKNTFIGTIDGPGGVITSMEVIVNQVVVGTLSFKFASLPIPEHILKQK